MDLSTIPTAAWVVIGSAVTGIITLAGTWIQGRAAIRTANRTAEGQIEAVRAEALAVRQRDAAEARRELELKRLGEVFDHAESVISNFLWLTSSWEPGTGMIPNRERHDALRTIEGHLAKLRLRAPEMELPDQGAAFAMIHSQLTATESFDLTSDHTWFLEYREDFEKAVSEYLRSARVAVTTEEGPSPNAYPTKTPE